MQLVTADGKQYRTADGKILFVSGEVLEEILIQDNADRVSVFEENEYYSD